MYHRLKRYAKNIILIALICSSVALVSQIWFGSLFIAGGYNGVWGNVKGYVTKLFGGIGRGEFSQNIKILLKPEKVVANQSGKRSVLYRASVGYDSLLDVSNSLMSEFLLGNAKVKNKEIVDTNEYLSVLKGKSLYVDYGNIFDSKLFSVSICGEDNTQFTSEISTIREYMVLFNDNILNTVSIYMRDYKTRNITKYTVEYNKAKLENAITKYFNSGVADNVASYSFELNFHQEVNSDGSIPKVIFTPLILLDLMPGEKEQLIPDNLPYFNQYGEMDTYTEDLILKAFYINPMTMRKYIDLSNAKVFVENEGTLTIDPDGYLEYKTLQSSNGLNLERGTAKNSYDAYTTTTLAVDFVSAICNSFPKNTLDGLRISSGIAENTNKQGAYRFTFDYYINGVPVLQIDPETGLPQSAVEMIIENGYLKYYRHCLKTYEVAETKSTMRSVINAADSVVDQLKAKDAALIINKVGFCYIDDGSKLLSRKWQINVNGKTDAIILD